MNLDEFNNPFLPYSNFRYQVTEFGDIININSNSKLDLIEKDDGLYVELDWVDGKKLYNAAIVVIVAFRHYMLLPSYHYKDIIPLYRNGDCKDLTPNNLTYKLPIYGIILQHRFLKDFCYIPEYTSYAINKDGRIYNIRRDSIYNPLKIDPNNSMRNTVSVMSDFKRNNHPSIYRLLALTFIDHDSDYEELDINHINGNKHDDRVENLEWVTHRYNMIHAVETGLRTDNKVIEIKSYLTNEIARFRSIAMFLEHFNASKYYLRRCIKDGFMKLSSESNDWYYIRFENNEWKNVNQVDLNKIKTRENKDSINIKSYNIVTKEIKEFSSYSEAAKKLSLERRSISSHVESDSTVPIRGYIFRYLIDDREVPVFNEDQLYFYKYHYKDDERDGKPQAYQGYIVINKDDNTKHTYTSVRDIAKLIDVSWATLYVWLRENKVDNVYTYNNYIIKIISLEGKKIDNGKSWDEIKEEILKQYGNKNSNTKTYIEVKVKNYVRNKEIKFSSISNCNKALNLYDEYVKESMKIGFMKLSYDPNDWYYITEGDNDFKEFTENEIEEFPVKFNAKETPIKALNVFTNSLFIFKNVSDASNKTGISRKSINFQIDNDSKMPYKEYLFRKMDDMRPFPKFTDGQLDILKYNIKNGYDISMYFLKRGFVVTDLTTNEKRIWCNIRDLGKFLNIGHKPLYKIGKDKENDRVFHNRYQVSVINLEGTI